MCVVGAASRLRTGPRMAACPMVALPPSEDGVSAELLKPKMVPAPDPLRLSVC